MPPNSVNVMAMMRDFNGYSGFCVAHEKSVWLFSVFAKSTFQAVSLARTSLKKSCRQACKLAVCEVLYLRLESAQADVASAAVSNKLLYTVTSVGHCASLYEGIAY